MAYETLCASVRGSSHVKKGIPCEDFGLAFQQGGFFVFVVSDGHGDSNCPRSSFGSEAVCRIASEELISFASSIEREGWCDKLLDPVSAEKLVRHLAKSIVGKWKERVIEDFEQNPLSDEERAGCSKYIARYDNGERIDHIYGATMIAGLLTERYVLLLQQGDGRCDVFDASGTVSQPIPWDESCFANVTTSMCDVDASEKCRFWVSNNEAYPVSAIVAGSDGVEDSFLSMDQVHSYYRRLLVRASEIGVDALASELEEDLPSFSAKGSGDDVTICGFIDTAKIGELKERFEKDNAEVDRNVLINDIESRLSSMEGKVSFLQAKRDAVLAQYEELNVAYRKAREEADAYAQGLQGVSRQMGEPGFNVAVLGEFYRSRIVNDMESKLCKAKEGAAEALESLKQAEEKMNPVLKEFDAIMERRQGYLREKERLIAGEPSIVGDDDDESFIGSSVEDASEETETQKDESGLATGPNQEKTDEHEPFDQGDEPSLHNDCPNSAVHKGFPAVVSDNSTVAECSVAGQDPDPVFKLADETQEATEPGSPPQEIPFLHDCPDCESPKATWLSRLFGRGD